jgi:hypothetical protein
MMIAQPQNHQLSSSGMGASPAVLTTEAARSKEDHRSSSSTVNVGTGATGTVTPINDNSNPQSGTSIIGSDAAAANTEFPKDVPSDHQNMTKVPSQDVPNKQPRKVSSGDIAMSASSTGQNPTSNSNNSSYTKDARKLFVGGLPQDSKWH